ncbi:hypothetical protein [Anaerococcus tetradius]|uniref:Uncharacterized protein n=1 Tax=Anaerococcus tetradius ATCC 35098 TaxID=525255 RepID=C2CFZ0_9FIRM|nr:hypothetical protein [Anaerococcus tetradius]EEI83518.1 hypothetical protein HMPREF0077_0400 [Anaerococcus tetradius ATCC 35098]
MANIRMLQSTFLTSTPLIKVISEGEEQSHIVGSNPHDQFILGRNGGLHYYNLQCCESTEEYGCYKFDLKEPENDYEEITFDKVDFIELMDIDAKRFGLKDDSRYILLKKEIEKLFECAIEDRENEKQEILYKVLSEVIKDSKEVG